MSLAEQLAQRLSELDCPDILLESRTQEQIIQYLLLIEKWNKRYNLTAVRTIEAMLYQHIMDSLSVVTHLYGPQVVDVGTGAGLPGIPIAIARPDWQVTLIESNQKKAAFLQQVKIQLDLANITVVAQRIENTIIEKIINSIISRAYASLSTFIQTTRHWVTPGNDQCRWIAMKGNCTHQELKEVMAPFYVECKIPLIVPGLSAKRELVVIRQSIKPVAPVQNNQE
ncbi:MAG TPA: 16S rRNA (guanine(527)-N(7))-methyltransferase RsmG [Nitrosomonas sp.]|nr:16S rRNA (guanine(527)-N(7))-methyltransferase RsmG [Nitrosomonas sp.]HNP26125.1 16S rRNA (guanine(527)-N(7))-methyltransferase RsmG [Nitrosomonas sp.]